MSDVDFELSSILVDVELPAEKPLSKALVDVLSSLRVVLVGWYEVPEQTSPEQARDQFEPEAEASLDQVAEAFENAGATVHTRLVFTGDRLDTISRISREEDCDAVLIPQDVEDLQRLLVPLRGAHNARRIAPLVADLVRDGETEVTLLHVLEGDETAESSRERVLNPMVDILAGYGIDAGILRLESVTAEDPGEAIIDASRKHDIVVLGETEPSVREILFGTVPEQIVDAAEIPVIVVRHGTDTGEVAERATQADAD